MKPSPHAFLKVASSAVLVLIFALSSCSKLECYLPKPPVKPPVTDTVKPSEPVDTVKPVPPVDTLVEWSKPIALFMGSSTFTKWTNAQSYFPDDSIINRGFGGSRLNDVLLKVPSYRDECDPQNIVIYCGVNDAFSFMPSADMFAKYKQLHTESRRLNPKAHLINLGLVISPRACKEINPKTNLPIRATIENYNRLVREWLDTQENSEHVEMAHNFLTYPDKMPNPTLFMPDSLHNTTAAYEIWAREIKKTLTRNKQ